MNRLSMENYLLILKSTVEVYIHGTLESSYDSARDVLKNSLKSTLENQAATYEVMTKYGWYKKENTSVENINKTLNKVLSVN